VVELRGFEPLTFSMPLRRAPNCATAPQALQSARKTAHCSTVSGATPSANRPASSALLTGSHRPGSLSERTYYSGLPHIKHTPSALARTLNYVWWR
jgi:hypothetical protein